MADRKRGRDASPDPEAGEPSRRSLVSSPLRSLSEAPFSEADVDDGLQEQLLNDLLEDDEDEEGVDLFGDNLDRDYREKLHLDHYEVESADGEEYGNLDRDTRLLAEAKMRRRDREAGRIPDAFLDEEEDELEENLKLRRRRKDEFDVDIDLAADEVLPLDVEALKDIKGSLAEFVTMEAPRKTIQNEFHRFLTSYVSENGESVYGERIKAMCEVEGQSLVVDYTHLHNTNATLAYFVVNCPIEVLKIFDMVAMDVILSGFEHYAEICPEVHVRIANLPVVETLRDLRQAHLNTLVRVSGVITRRTNVFPQLKYVKYDCVKCGAVLGPYYQDSNREISIRTCPSCQSRGPFVVNAEETVYRNYQRMTLQESPGSVPAGRLPRHRDVIVVWDLVDYARPGDHVEITGVYRNNFDVSLNTKNGFPVFSTVIEANHISKREDEFASFRLTEEDQREIRRLSKDPNIKKRIIKSIAPSIYGHEDIKTALSLAMFGGVFKNPQGKHRLRGDINVLLLGDPGTAKSQFLKYVEKTSHRAVYATGQGASAVGLTAAVHKDPVTREWTLEGGALVMADRGVCLIDEFDKMNDKDRTSIHEAMEQQSISISKAGIITTLQARCAVVAAANPISGKYNAQLPFSQNVELTEPILSRFDVLCVVKDIANPVADESLARFVLNSHIRSHPDAQQDDQVAPEMDADIIDQEMLRKYIMYARTHCRPSIENVDVNKLERLYADLRRESMSCGGIPITVRYLESIVRMAESFARMHLRDQVRTDDVDHAISVMIRSFISAQKYSAKKYLTKVFEKYMTYDQDSFGLIHHVLSELEREHIQFQFYKTDKMPNAIEMDVEELEMRVKDLQVHDLKPYFDSRLFKEAFVFDGARQKIVSKSRVDLDRSVIY